MRSFLAAVCVGLSFAVSALAACPAAGAKFFLIADTQSTARGINGSYAYLDFSPHLAFPANASSADLFYLSGGELYSTAATSKDYLGTYELNDGYGLMFAPSSFGLTPVQCKLVASRAQETCRLTCIPGFPSDATKWFEGPYEKGWSVAYLYPGRVARTSPMSLLVEAAD